MISDRKLFVVKKVGDALTSAPAEKAVCQRWLDYRRKNRPNERWEMIETPSCRCCGEASWENLRCTKHQDRNPCAVEGCKRTRRANGNLSDCMFICGEHWKAYVPPGSPERRVINRLFALAKKMGFKRNDRWPVDLEERYWRFWQGLCRRVRARSTEGTLDEKEIMEMFGWSDDA